MTTKQDAYASEEETPKLLVPDTRTVGERTLDHTLNMISAVLRTTKEAEQTAPVQQDQHEFTLRGILASELKCWHRLTKDEANNLLAFLKRIAPQPVQQEEPVVSKATYNRIRDDYNELLTASKRDAADAKSWRNHVDRCQLGQVDLDHVFTSPPAQRKPLTDEQFASEWHRRTGRIMGADKMLLLQAKYVTETAHGIKGDA